MDKVLHFEITTPERVVFSAPSVESITLPTEMGEITILPDHLPLVASLMPGELHVKIGGEEILRGLLLIIIALSVINVYS